ncbi:2-keto-4-pentenoate hydratase [Sporosarcina pasteurii]|uniref:2-keto-4-pentenoate hydratase n=1 Tax=Sporosarcina pasteurii TaxID=1474 RepID=A0A380CDQ9_SPOPA|nr:2-keto-4-pentenoate hydratase [Sporosarcina pasteurii]MDS9473120.1 2-keto-4-pentenoate hydratase [Sporosarcina pasteurii]QBQ04231.1 2-keto-4-pentenoate hydratase [Sporosarcina pasteurii]SUJ17249.1 2-keto-4-pentenoate hydratase [Sporosarcina pasteurii]
MTSVVDEVVGTIINSHETKQPIEFIRHRYTLDEETAYLVQEKLIHQKCASKNTEVAGYKISMTSAETQAIANTDEPAYGTLLSTHILHSGESISLSSMFAPLIEPEIMFVLTDDLSPGASEDEIIKKSKICAGIEIPDARYIDWFPNFSLSDLLCDNTATGLVVLAEPIEPFSIKAFEQIKMELFHDGEKISEGLSSAVLGNPVSSVAWLARKLAKKNKTLKKDMIISSGTFISPLVAKEGTYKVSYSDIGEVEVTFVQ